MVNGEKKMLSDIIQKRIELPLSVLLKTYNPEHVYFVLYLNLLTKILFSDKGTYNPYNLDFDNMKDTEVNDIMYIIRIFDGYTESGHLEKLYDAIVYHYTNVYGPEGDGIVVDNVFWLQRIFALIEFITLYTNFKMGDCLQIIYILLGMKAYDEWNTDRHVMQQVHDYFVYIVTKLPKLKFGEFY